MRDSTLSVFVCLLTVISFWGGLGEGLKEAWRAAIHGVAKSRTLLSDGTELEKAWLWRRYTGQESALSLSSPYHPQLQPRLDGTGRSGLPRLCRLRALTPTGRPSRAGLQQQNPTKGGSPNSGP